MATPAIPALLEFRDDEKPYVEVVRGRLEPKVSPRRRHAILQQRFARILGDWSGPRGEVGTEWRFYLLGEERPSSLVPDVAYVSYERLPRKLPTDARERPRIAPDIAVEILSPGDSRTTLEKKIRLYLMHGSRVVIVADPDVRMLALHLPEGTPVHATHGVLGVAPYDDLILDIDALFEGL
jgi:Uma2 family endonuclease